MAKASRKQLAALRKARAAKRRYARGGHRRAGEAKARKTTIRRGVKGKFLRKKVRGYTHEARRSASRRRRRRHAREVAAAAPRRRRGRSRRGKHYVRGHYSYEARRRGRRRRSHAREYAFEAHRRRRGGGRRRRRYAGALENPLSGMELAITILTGSVGFMAAEIADRFMAVRKGAPVVTLAINGGKAPQLPMYDDWPRLVVAGAITAAPLVASAFVKQPTWRSALQTMGIGAGLRSVGNILVGLAAKFTAPAADAQLTDAQKRGNIFAFEQSLQDAYATWNKQTADQKTAAEKAYEGTAGLPQGTGACPTCKRTDGLGACCRGGAQPPAQQQQPLPPPPPITATPPAQPPATSMTPPVVPQSPPAISTPPATPPPAVTVPGNPPLTPAVPPLSTVPGPRAQVPGTVAPPVTSFAAPAPGGGVRGIPQRFMAGTGSIAPRPRFNWGHQGNEADAAE